MKLVNIILAAALLAIPVQMRAVDPKDILSGLGSALSGSSEESSQSSTLGALGDLISNFTASSNFSVDDLTGTWTYKGPAVSFESENALQKVGGTAAASAVESKLAPYYTKLGFTKTTLTVDADHNFTFKLGAISLTGVVEKDGDQLVFNFNAFNKISLGKVKANASKSGNQLNLTFDATRLVQILKQVSSKLNIATLNTVSSLLTSYDGIFIGFKLQSK